MYKLSKKVNDKWHIFGNVKENKYGHLQASFKITPEFKRLIEESGEWLNLSVFEDTPKETTKQVNGDDF